MTYSSKNGKLLTETLIKGIKPVDTTKFASDYGKKAVLKDFFELPHHSRLNARNKICYLIFE